jgi:hypothetical protein
MADIAREDAEHAQWLAANGQPLPNVVSFKTLIRQGMDIRRRQLSDSRVRRSLYHRLL